MIRYYFVNDEPLTEDGMILAVGPAQSDLLLQDCWNAMKQKGYADLRANWIRECGHLRHSAVPLNRAALLDGVRAWGLDNLAGERTNEARYELMTLLHVLFLIGDIDYDTADALGLYNDEAGDPGAAGPFPVCPKCRTMVSKTKGRLHLVWPGEPRPDGDHGWLSVDISRYHREPVLVLNVGTTLEDDDGTTYPVVESVVVDHRRFGIAPDALDDAVAAAGGNRYREGQHPVSDRIRTAVLEKMGWVADVDAIGTTDDADGDPGELDAAASEMTEEMTVRH